MFSNENKLNGQNYAGWNDTEFFKVILIFFFIKHFHSYTPYIKFVYLNIYVARGSLVEQIANAMYSAAGRMQHATRVRSK